MPDALLQFSNSFECLIDLLGKISQILSTNGLDDLFFLIGQRKCLTQVPVRKRPFRLTQQGFAELIIDNRRCKQSVQSGTCNGRFAKAGEAE